MSAATVQSIVRYVEELSGHPLRGDEGVHYGEADRAVTRVTVCWMATVAALEQAGRDRADLVLAHESLFYPYGKLLEKGKTQDWESWKTNRQRIETMENYGVTVLRVHGSLDEICIFDDFARTLELGTPVEADGLAKVYEVTPCSVHQLVEHVKHRTGMPAVRVSPPNGLDQTVRRVGLPWGGLGLFVNVSYQQQLVEKNCDVFIAGESDDYGFRFCAELGIPMIETSHEVSENPGLRRFTDMLGKRFPGLKVAFFECKQPWEML